MTNNDRTISYARPTRKAPTVMVVIIVTAAGVFLALVLIVVLGLFWTRSPRAVMRPAPPPAAPSATPPVVVTPDPSKGVDRGE